MQIFLFFLVIVADFAKIDLKDTNVISIYDVRDANANKYYEVPYLGQELVYIDYPNTAANEPDLFQFREDVPSILKTLRTPRRFTTVVNEDFTTTIQCRIESSSKDNFRKFDAL